MGHRQYSAQQRRLRLGQFQVMERCWIAQSQHGFTVVQAKSQCVRPEQHGQRHRYRAHLQNCNIRDRSRKTLRHHNSNAITRHNAMVAQDMGQLVGSTLQLVIGIGSRAAIWLIFGNCYAVRSATARPATATNLSHIEMRRHLPAKAVMPFHISWGQKVVCHRCARPRFTYRLRALSVYHPCNVPSQTTRPQ